MDINLRNTIIGRVGRDVGSVAALVLLNLIETFPDRLTMLNDHALMRADIGAPEKLHMDSKLYYLAIAALKDKEYIAQIQAGRSTYYGINFEKLQEMAPKDDEEVAEYEVVE